MAEHLHNSSILEVEAGESEVQGYPQLHSEFKVSQGYTKPCLKISKNTIKKIFFCLLFLHTTKPGL